MAILHLRLLGATQLSTRDGLPLQVSNRTRALLAAAAVGGPVGLSRESAMALFWPDSDPLRGRNSLRQRLFTLRKELNVEPLLHSPETLRLDPAVVSVDLWEFEAAVAANQAPLAASLYGGTFMDGFTLSGVSELERWIEAERSRLRGVAARMMDRVATDCTRRADHAGAVDWRRRLAVLDPLSSRVAADLVHALVAFKDRVGALQYARVHTELVRQELDTEPDPSFAVLVKSLDMRKTPLPAPLKLEPHSDPAYRLHDGASDAPGHDGKEPESPNQPQRSWATPRRVAWLALAAVLVASVSLAVRSAAGRIAPPRTFKSLLIVGRFTSAGEGQDPVFGRGIARLLTAALNEGRDVQAITAGSTQQRANWIVMGSVSRIGDRIVIDASLMDVRRQREMPLRLQGSSDSTFELVEELAAQVLAAQRRARSYVDVR